MRYADGPVAGCEVHIEAPPERVWELVADIGVPARLSPELRAAEWLESATGPELGARFVGYNKHRTVGDWRTLSHVVELDEPRVFGWAVVDPDGRFGGGDPDPDRPLALWRFELEPEAAGTRLRQSARIGPARSALSLAIDHMPDREEEFVAIRLTELRTNIQATLRGIKTMAESPRD